MVLSKGAVELPKRLRKLGMSQRELERKLRPERPVYGLVSRIISGEREFDVWQAAIVEDLLEIPASWFGKKPNNCRAD